MVAFAPLKNGKTYMLAYSMLRLKESTVRARNKTIRARNIVAFLIGTEFKVRTKDI